MEQITDTILMVRPANFGFNEQTAGSNAFQKLDKNIDADSVKAKSLAEFDAFVAKLRATGVHIIVVEDTPEPIKPDAIFPNNWVSFHEEGRVVLYPMMANVRRLERRMDIIESLKEKYAVSSVEPFLEGETKNQFLEGTGSMIIDRQNGIVYACTSPRTNPTLFEEFCKKYNYQALAFKAEDSEGQEIYHTNVMMALGESFAVICLDSISSETEKAKVISTLTLTNKEIIDISFQQMNRFAGNMLQVRNKAGERFLVMSEQAYNSLSSIQIRRLEQHTKLLYIPLYTIEKLGGGSARCMMAEVFLPQK